MSLINHKIMSLHTGAGKKIGILIFGTARMVNAVLELNRNDVPYVAVSKRSKVNALRRTVAAHACTIQYRVRQAILSRNKTDSHWNYMRSYG